MVKQTERGPMITVNFGKGTPQEAADWVKYVNIEKKAGVKLWEVGNEIYGAGTRTRPRGPITASARPNSSRP